MNTDESGSGEIMLFGVRVVVDSMRKSVSLNNLSQYQQPEGLIDKPVEAVPVAEYASADEAAHRYASAGPRDRKRGVPWKEEEHKMFLVGLQKVGKGDWRGISKNYVKTRTPTQVASHAQKYFLRRTNFNRRRRRSSLFDITTDTLPINENVAENNQDKVQPLALPTPEVNNGFNAMTLNKPMEQLSIAQSGDQNANTVLHGLNLNLNMEPMSSDTDLRALSLSLSLSTDNSYNNLHDRNSRYQAMPRFNDSDSFVWVA